MEILIIYIYIHIYMLYFCLLLANPPEHHTGDFGVNIDSHIVSQGRIHMEFDIDMWRFMVIFWDYGII